jgi:hypothetical protein
VTARLDTELRLVGSFLRTGGGPRAVLVAGCTALVSGLLLVALTVVLFTLHSSREEEQISDLVADGGIRGGYLLALLLICVAPLALLRQGVRLGTATREQRLAALRLAGATMSEVRRIGALEVGLPALAGGFLGYLVFAALRAVFGGQPRGEPGGAQSEVAHQLQLVPTSVTPAWWHVLLIALGVGLVGVLAGATASRSLVISPLGVSRRAPRSAPRPWAALLLLLVVALFLIRIAGGSGDPELYTFITVAALVLGLLALAPWVAYRIGRTVAARSSSVAVLVAGRRLATDARAAGRAAAAVGAIAVIAGGGGVVLADLPDSYEGGGFGDVEPFYMVPIVLAGLVLLAALLLVTFSMAVHGVESMVDRKRSMAALAALGASAEELERVQRWEVGLVALPMAVIGVLVGSGPFLLALGASDGYAWIPFVVDGVTIALVWLAVRISTRITRPWLVRASAPANLRTA